MSVWFHIQTPHYIWLQNTKMVVVKITISRIHKFSYSTPNSESAVNLTDVLGLRGHKTEQGTGKTCTIHIGRPQVTVFFFFLLRANCPTVYVHTFMPVRQGRGLINQMRFSCLPV